MHNRLRIPASLMLLMFSVALLLSACSTPESQRPDAGSTATDTVNDQSVSAAGESQVNPVAANQPPVAAASGEASTEPSSASLAKQGPPASQGQTISRGARLVASFTVFLLSVFVGFEVITKVPPTLHTPLMSGSNAISGITVIGALLTAGHTMGGFGAFLGMLATILAVINVVGGFLVTHRMLMMFKKR